MHEHKAIVQFTRYAIVGLVSNGLLYIAYLLLTGIGMDPKISMTILYALGVLQTFVFNKKWSFRHHGKVSYSLVKYILSYLLGYLINLFVLWYFVDILAYPHQIVQAIMIVLLAVMLFALQRYWVFPHHLKQEVITAE